MSSNLKTITNRENATHSTGPRTPAGKQRSRFNATRHGLTGQVNVRTEEERQARILHCDSFFEDLKPQGAVEKHLVQTMADKQWQIHKADALLDSVYALGHDELADQIVAEHAEIHAALVAGLVTIDKGRQLDLIGRYSSRLQRDYRLALKDLQTLQDQRKQRERDEMAEAALVRKLCEMKGERFNPVEFGFVSQPEQVDRHIRRREYVTSAGVASKFGSDRKKYSAAVGG